MNLLAQATSGFPFFNGTEENAWMDVWCRLCVHEHDMSHNEGLEGGCSVLSDYFIGTMGDSNEWNWPEAWLPEPLNSFSLPSRMVCGMFEPCTKDNCEGDPHTDLRAEIVQDVTSWWKEYGHAH